ncbi:MAG TPA: MlaD family protein [Solirubrobacteraceae bacterium]|jgi:ABC-type transporter Mla subunit MlaD|nr:MlaD family protein [Solirubrobacteraceae bacterium]
MRRLAILAVLGACALVVAVLGSGSGSASSYRVRAIFTNAFSVIPGEDVKVAGVRVGKIESLDVTGDQKAAVVLSITQPGFDDFRADATCTIRPQSLIGEKFVECAPTQPRAPGAPLPPVLQRVPDGQPGAGQYLLPETQTSRPVDLDLINNILRLPFRERLSIIINEFGTGLAGRGSDLRSIIRRANPALRATDRVLKILGSQNRVLAALARNSDTSLAPLSARRAQVASFVNQANTTAVATAQRGSALEANLQRLPRFLAELRPTMVRLGALSDEMTPVLSDLGSQAPAISRFIFELGPFSRAATPSLVSLGAAADVGRVALPKSLPIIRDLRSFASVARPLSANLSALTSSLHDTGGIERALDYAFYQVAAINGFDSFGHYLRAALIVNTCSTYVTVNDPTCSANFQKAAGGASARSASTAGRSPYLVREDAALRRALRGGSVSRAPAGAGPAPAAPGARPPAPGALRLPGDVLPGSPSPAGAPGAPGADGAAAPPAAGGGAAGAGPDSATSLLNYLLGSG